MKIMDCNLGLEFAYLPLPETLVSNVRAVQETVC